jgi:hypothetical protein
MHVNGVLAALVLLCALFPARGEPPREAVPAEPKGLFEVPFIIMYDINGRKSFNSGREFVIAINEQLPDARARRAKLTNALEGTRHLDGVVFEWFGKKPPKRLDIEIGDQVPVELVQQVIAAYADKSQIPVHLTLATKDEATRKTHRVYIGSLDESGKDPATPELIRELLKPGLRQQQLAKLLSDSGD